MKFHEEILKGIYRIRGKRSNMYLVADGPLSLIDCGMPGDERRVLGALQDIGRAPGELKYIFITHAHLDHIGALAALKAATGACVVAGRAEVDYIEGRRMLCSMRREGLGGAVFRAMLFLLETCLVGYAPAGVDAAWPAAADQEGLAGLEIIEAPGHSLGSLCFLHTATRALFTGDALSAAPHLRLPPRAGCADYARALDTVQRLSELEVQACLCGHGDPVVGRTQANIKRLMAGRR